MNTGPLSSDLTLVLVLILPLIPAYILFKTLPGGAFVSGPLKGFDINLSGAFAGYFALVLLNFCTLPLWRPSEKPLQEDWTVTGTVEYDKGNTENLSSQTRLLLIPPRPSVTRDGDYIVSFKLPAGISKRDLPNLVIDLPGYKMVQIPLSGEAAPYQQQAYRVAIEQHHIEVPPVMLEPVQPQTAAVVAAAPYQPVQVATRLPKQGGAQ